MSVNVHFPEENTVYIYKTKRRMLSTENSAPMSIKLILFGPGNVQVQVQV